MTALAVALLVAVLYALFERGTVTRAVEED